jgi:protein ImuA
MTSFLSHQTLHQTVQPALRRTSHRSTPNVNVFEGVALQQARVHECNGRSRVGFAMIVAAQITGHVFWIAPKWQRETLNPDGMRAFTKPQNFTFITPARPEDILWVMEETLRSGAVPLVVAQMPSLPSLTAVRRLHLAAEHSTTAPLGLLLTASDSGRARGRESLANAAQSWAHITMLEPIAHPRPHRTRQTLGPHKNYGRSATAPQGRTKL